MLKLFFESRSPEALPRTPWTTNKRGILFCPSAAIDRLKTQFDIRPRSFHSYLLDFTTIRMSRRRTCEEANNPRAANGRYGGSRYCPFAHPESCTGDHAR